MKHAHVRRHVRGPLCVRKRVLTCLCMRMRTVAEPVLIVISDHVNTDGCIVELAVSMPFLSFEFFQYWQHLLMVMLVVVLLLLLLLLLVLLVVVAGVVPVPVLVVVVVDGGGIELRVWMRVSRGRSVV